jgi:hypothetical protein
MAFWEIVFVIFLVGAGALALWQALQAAKEGTGKFNED